MQELKKKVAVVTGAASGIGLAMAKAFAAEGMLLVLADVEAEALEAARASLAGQGADVLAVGTDVSDPAAVEELRDAALSRFGGVHLVCNNAGVAVGGQSWEVSLAAWRWVFGVNLWGVVHGVRAFVPLLREQGEGHVVNTASAAGLLAAPFLGPYAATKHAVVALSESLALELEGSGVGVSVLCPLWVRTRIHESDRNAPPELGGAFAAQALPGREVVAGLVNSGLAPEVVAGRVVEAVKGGGFWVFPHDGLRQAVAQRGERISRGLPPRFELFG